MMEWVSVADRLPDFEGTLLCYIESSIHKGTYYVAVAYFEDGWFYDTDGIGLLHGRVTHWMELLQPPKMDKGELT